MDVRAAAESSPLVSHWMRYVESPEWRIAIPTCLGGGSRMK